MPRGSTQMPWRLCRDLVPRAAVLTPILQNPTTATMSPTQRQAAMEAARAADLVIIEDDINGHLAGAEAPLALLDPDRVILVTSLSKSIAPGLRVGQMLAPARYGAAVQSALYALGWTGPALQVALATQLIGDDGAMVCPRAQQCEAMARVRLLRQYLSDAAMADDPAQAAPRPLYHAWLPMPPGRRETFEAELLARQVLAAPGRDFLQDDDPAPEWSSPALGQGLHSGQAAPQEWIRMHVEELHAAVAPAHHLMFEHQRACDLSRRPDPADACRDRFLDLPRALLAKWHARRIAHGLRQIARPDEQHVDAIHLQDRIQVAQRRLRLDHANDQPFLVIGGAGPANRLDDDAGLVGGFHQRHHQAVRTAVEIADQDRALVRIRPDDRTPAARPCRHCHRAHILEASASVLAVEEHRIRA